MRLSGVPPWLVAIWLTICAACNYHKTIDPAVSEIRVPVAASREEAFRRARAALEGEGLEIDPPLKRDTIVYTMPREVSPGVVATYRAVSHAVDSTAVVILSGTVFNRREAAWDQAILGIPKRREDVLTAKARGDEQAAWQQLQRVATRLRADTGSTPRTRD